MIQIQKFFASFAQEMTELEQLLFGSADFFKICRMIKDSGFKGCLKGLKGTFFLVRSRGGSINVFVLKI